MTTDKDDDNVSFIDLDESGETEVHIGAPEKEKSSNDSDARLARAEAEQAQLRGQLSYLQGQQNQSQPQQNRPDPYASQLDEISQQERALGIQFEALRVSKGLTQEVVNDYDQKARNLQQRRADVAAQRAIEGVVPRLVNMQQQQYFRAQYADVQDHQSANNYAQARYHMLLAEGSADTPETVERAMNDARIKFGLGGKKMSPTDQDKRQLSGVGGGGGRSTNSNTVKMGKPEKQMAMAMYKDVTGGDEKKAYAMWAKNIGVKAAKEIAKSRSR